MEERILAQGKAKKANPIVLMCAGATLLFLWMGIKMEMVLMTIMGAVYAFLTAFAAFGMSRAEITVTDKRIYGKRAFGIEVNLPLDSVSSVESVSGFVKAITIATSSGKIGFSCLENHDQICEEIRNLLNNRQSKASVPTQTTIKQEVAQSDADELKKFKELLDSGIISQEEFDAKKKQLLGL